MRRRQRRRSGSIMREFMTAIPRCGGRSLSSTPKPLTASSTASRAFPSPLWGPKAGEPRVSPAFGPRKGEGDAFRLPAHVPHPDGPKGGRDPRSASRPARAAMTMRRRTADSAGRSGMSRDRHKCRPPRIKLKYGEQRREGGQYPLAAALDDLVPVPVHECPSGSKCAGGSMGQVWRWGRFFLKK
jgi:hypothetical protein